MHIIKITPVSFKIILSKQDLERYGTDNLFDHTDISGEFFADIIDKTNKLYGYPFAEGALDAEFFQSKDGGGELFISSKVQKKNTTYLFVADNCESLVAACKRLDKYSGCTKSDLYFDGEVYKLAIFADGNVPMLLPVLSEYGKAYETGKFGLWLVEEHSKPLLCGNAVNMLASHF